MREAICPIACHKLIDKWSAEKPLSVKIINKLRFVGRRLFSFFFSVPFFLIVVHRHLFRFCLMQFMDKRAANAGTSDSECARHGSNIRLVSYFHVHMRCASVAGSPPFSHAAQQNSNDSFSFKTLTSYMMSIHTA